MPYMEEIAVGDTFINLANVQTNSVKDEKGKNLFDKISLLDDKTEYTEIYRVIDKLNSALNFIPPKDFFELLIEAINDDWNKTVGILNNYRDVFVIYCTARILTFREDIPKIDLSKIKNSLLKSEIIRNKIENCHNELTDEENIFLVKEIVELSEININVFEQLFMRIQKKAIIYTILPEILNNLCVKALYIFINLIPFDGLDKITQVNSMLNRIDDRVYKIIFRPIIEKWNNHLELLKREHEYLNEPVFNSYSNLILHCLIWRYEDNRIDFINDIEQILNDANISLFQWYKSSSKMQCAYFVDITRFYLLNLVNDNLKLINSNQDISLYEKISCFLKTQIKYLHFWHYSEKNPNDYLKFDILNLPKFEFIRKGDST